MLRIRPGPENCSMSSCVITRVGRRQLHVGDKLIDACNGSPPDLNAVPRRTYVSTMKCSIIGCVVTPHSATTPGRVREEDGGVLAECPRDWGKVNFLRELRSNRAVSEVHGFRVCRKVHKSSVIPFGSAPY